MYFSAPFLGTHIVIMRVLMTNLRKNYMLSKLITTKQYVWCSFSTKVLVNRWSKTETIGLQLWLQLSNALDLLQHTQLWLWNSPTRIRSSNIYCVVLTILCYNGFNLQNYKSTGPEATKYIINSLSTRGLHKIARFRSSLIGGPIKILQQCRFAC